MCWGAVGRFSTFDLMPCNIKIWPDRVTKFEDYERHGVREIVPTKRWSTLPAAVHKV
jgi:hypothetical protein